MKQNMIELNKPYKLCKLRKSLKIHKEYIGQLKKILYEAEFELVETPNEQLSIKIMNIKVNTGVKMNDFDQSKKSPEQVVRAIASILAANEINKISFDHEKFDKALKFFADTVGNILDDIKTLEDVIALYNKDNEAECFYVLTPQLLYDYERKLLYAIILNIHHLIDTSKDAEISMQKMINCLNALKQQRINKNKVEEELKGIQECIKDKLGGDWLKSMRDKLIAHVDVNGADNAFSEMVTDFDIKFDKIKCISKDLESFNKIIWHYCFNESHVYCARTSPIKACINSIEFRMSRSKNLS